MNPFSWLSILSCSVLSTLVNWHIWHIAYFRKLIRYLQILFDPGQKYLLYLWLPCWSLTLAEPVLWLVITLFPSSHISTCCLMEACNMVLMFTLLFSIKGQTVQNSTVIPHTLCSHLTPVSFYTVVPCNRRVFTSKLSTVQHGSCKFNASLYYSHSYSPYVFLQER